MIEAALLLVARSPGGITSATVISAVLPVLVLWLLATNWADPSLLARVLPNSPPETRFNPVKAALYQMRKQRKMRSRELAERIGITDTKPAAAEIRQGQRHTIRNPRRD